MFGYSEGMKGYKLWCKDKGQSKVFISRDVKLKEHEMYHQGQGSDQQVETQKENVGIQLEVESSRKIVVNEILGVEVNVED